MSIPSTAKEGKWSSEPREISEGIWWLPECLVLPLSGRVTHLHTAPYLIIGSEKTLLWDGGTPLQWPSVSRTVERLLDGRRLDYVVPSHPEVAHCGNVHRIMAKFPDAELVGDIRDYPLHFPQFTERMRELKPGTEIDLGDHTFVLLGAVIKDLPSSVWGYEASQGVLFVADGFAYSHQPPIEGDDRPTHAPGECTMLASELGDPPAAEQIVWITKAALYWTRFVPMDLFLAPFQELLERYPTRLVAPAHGAVIDDIDRTLWTVWEALRLSYDPELGVKHASVSFTEQ